MGAVGTTELLAKSKRVVIKIGSALLVDTKGGLRGDWLNGLADDVARLRSRGKDVMIVSSGSIALGRQVLGMDTPAALALEQSQAAAAVGQIRLARAYEAALSKHNITTAQVLVTLEDSADRRRYLNSRATLETLLGLGCVPIVNENDTVATDEIRFGDNDRLAAQVAALAGADALVLLSDVDGLYTADPKDPSAERLDVVTAITPDIEAMAGEAASATSKGGMKTKLMAARTATNAGCAMVICNGYVTNPLAALEAGGPATVFVANATPAAARKRWIEAMIPRGVISIDQGAATALQDGKSLLPAGVVSVEGDFLRGDPVDVYTSDRVLLAKGLVAYGAADAAAIAGAQSRDIAGIVGYPGRAALMHRDDMVILKRDR